MTETAIARRFYGLTCLWRGKFVEAKANLEQSLRLCNFERDREAKFRYGTDNGATARVYLAQTLWILGEVGGAQELAEEATAQAFESGHIPTLINVAHFKALFEICKGDARAAQRTSDNLLELSRKQGTTLYLLWAAVSSTWARARLGEREVGIADLGRLLAEYNEQGNKFLAPLFQGLLAELEADGADDNAERALTRIDEALALANETGEHLSDAFLHRIRGEILLKPDGAHTDLAEEAFLTAIAIAQQQKGRSFELRAALSLAKLYNATGRAGEAQAALAPALQGFKPTPEFPEIAEAQTLLAALA